MQQKYLIYLVLQSQDCNKRIFGKIQESSKGVVFQTRGCNKLFIYPDSATTRIVGQETKCFFLKSQDCNKRDLWPDSGIQQRVRFPDSESQQNINSCRVRIATKMLIPPASGLQQKGSLARLRNPAKGWFSRFGIATH